MKRTFLTVPVEPRLDARYRCEGLVTDESLTSLLQRTAQRWPWLPAVIDGEFRLTFDEVLTHVERAAAWLTEAGVRSGDVVTWQLPNWWESYVLGHAVWSIGAVNNPVMTLSRENELGQFVDELRPDVIVTCATFRGCDHASMLDAILEELGHTPKAKLVVRGSLPGWTTFADALGGASRAPAHAIAPGELALIGYTSGTTSKAKGVMHSGQSLIAEARQLTSFLGWTFDDVAYMAAPLAHMTGTLIGMLCPALIGGCSVLSDRWDADLALQQMIAHRVTISGGATTFLRELVAAVQSSGQQPMIRSWACGGAAVPADLIYKADTLGIPAFRLYGMSELPTATLSNRTFPVQLRAETDGVIAPGVEIRVTDDSGAVLDHGQQGELRVRGPERMCGYFVPDQTTLDDEGWIRTGDVGTVDELGNVRITGRIKDIINRGGEKFSAAEIEQFIVSHPDVAQAAVVPLPDARLGEVPLAVVVTAPGSTLDTEVLLAHLRDLGLPNQKLPVRWHTLDHLPMTESGKVRKTELVDRFCR